MVRKKYGTRYLLSVIASFLIRKLGLFDRLQLNKETIASNAITLFSNRVAYGPFKGMRLSNYIWWGKYDVLAKFLGQYEAQVLDKLVELGGHDVHFIDIGAADGYYGVGLLYSNIYKSATCFEISEKGRNVIYETAELNNVTDRILIFGEADQQTIRKCVSSSSQNVILCDIEGGEFALFTNEFLNDIRHCVVIIELHDYFFSEVGGNRREVLIKDAKKYFNISFIDRANPKVNNFEELREWDDDHRQLAFSEGRPNRMEWLILTPHHKMEGL